MKKTHAYHVAGKMGIATSLCCSWESGTRQPDSQQLKVLASVLEFEVKDFEARANYTEAGLILTADFLRRLRTVRHGSRRTIVRSGEGLLRRTTRIVDLKQVNHVLLQPHWRKDCDQPIA